MQEKSQDNYDLLNEIGTFITLVLRWEKNLSQEAVDVLLQAKDNVNKVKRMLSDNGKL